RYNPNGTPTGHYANVQSRVGGGYNTAALSYDNGSVVLAARDGNNVVRLHRLSQTLNHQQTASTGRTTTRVMAGVVYEPNGTRVIANGARLSTVVGSGEIAAASWWSGGGTVTGFGRLPDGRLAATTQSGTLYIYNPSHTQDSKLWSSWTKKDTTTGRESMQSPTQPVTWPARSYATIEVASGLAPGTDDVELYASEVSGDRLDM